MKQVPATAISIFELGEKMKRDLHALPPAVSSACTLIAIAERAKSKLAEVRRWQALQDQIIDGAETAVLAQAFDAELRLVDAREQALQTCAELVDGLLRMGEEQELLS